VFCLEVFLNVSGESSTAANGPFAISGDVGSAARVTTCADVKFKYQ
jgi:hypothetical protein